MTTTRDPVELMLQIATRFMVQGDELDQRVKDAVEAGASQGDIIALKNLADTSRLRALAAAQAAAPFVRPRLQAVEVSPATPETRSRFEQRLEEMSEDEVLTHLKAIAAGTATVALLETDDAEFEEVADADAAH